MFITYIFEISGWLNFQICCFFKISPGNLLIILYQLTKFEAPNYIDFQNSLITSFQCPNLKSVIHVTWGETPKKTFFFISPSNLLIIFYQLTKFEAQL